MLPCCTNPLERIRFHCADLAREPLPREHIRELSGQAQIAGFMHREVLLKHVLVGFRVNCGSVAFVCFSFILKVDSPARHDAAMTQPGGKQKRSSRAPAGRIQTCLVFFSVPFRCARAADGLQPSRAYPEGVGYVPREATHEEEGQGCGASRGQRGMFAVFQRHQGADCACLVGWG